jgi:hypothetical protein
MAPTDWAAALNAAAVMGGFLIQRRREWVK